MPSVLRGIAVPLVVVLAAMLAMWWMDSREEAPRFQEKPGCHRPAEVPLAARPGLFPAPNPCVLTWSDLSLAINDLVAGQKQQAAGFLGALASMTTRMDRHRDSKNCPYRAGAVSVRIYHQAGVSAAVVFSFQTGADVLSKVAACYLEPLPADCMGSTPHYAQGAVSTLVWLGSASVVCQEMTKSIAIVAPMIPLATVKSESGAKVRSLPRTNSEQIGDFPAAAFIRLDCYTVGQEVTVGQRRWQMVEGMGYVYDSLLEVITPSKPCPISDPWAVFTKDNARVRAEPSTAAPELVVAPKDTLGRAECVTTGSDVQLSGQTSSQWVKVSISGVTGYVSVLLLEHGPSLPACA